VEFATRSYGKAKFAKTGNRKSSWSGITMMGVDPYPIGIDLY